VPAAAATFGNVNYRSDAKVADPSMEGRQLARPISKARWPRSAFARALCARYVIQRRGVLNHVALEVGDVALADDPARPVPMVDEFTLQSGQHEVGEESRIIVGTRQPSSSPRPSGVAC
jgi:hypothetical protein